MKVVTLDNTCILFSCICQICKREFGGIQILKVHCAEEHNTKPQVPCVCGKMLTSVETFTKHRKKCCSKFEKLYSCDLCDQKFLLKNKMEHHMKIRHLTTSPKHICLICSKTFIKGIHLRSHLISHLPAEQKNLYTCDRCGRR